MFSPFILAIKKSEWILACTGNISSGVEYQAHCPRYGLRIEFTIEDLSARQVPNEDLDPIHIQGVHWVTL